MSQLKRSRLELPLNTETYQRICEGGIKFDSNR